MLYFVILLLFVNAARAATAEQWRGRSIYQIITDRYALPEGANPNNCSVTDQTWCGGTWNTITANLDYIQNAGFTAIWISPTQQNWNGPRSVYGDAYHGYWIQDINQLNDRMGTSDDLKALSQALHERGMYLMVDIVLNNVMSESLDITNNLSKYFFQNTTQYHPYCAVDYQNTTSYQNCWLGDTVVPLPDVNTQDQTVIDGYGQWIQQFVQEYSVDGLRIDAAKHVNVDFWPTFRSQAGVFTLGEVEDANCTEPAQYQGPLDGILHYPMYYALQQAFAIPGPQNMTVVTDMMSTATASFSDTTLLGNFLSNQDNQRWHNFSVDPQSLYNAMTFNFMSDGIPIVYYGQEQSFTGAGDPYNREPLWTSNYAQTDAYKLIQSLNQFRNFIVLTNSNWTTSINEVITATSFGLAMRKGGVVTILTNVGSPPAQVSFPVYTPWDAESSATNVLTCEQWPIGSNGTIEVSYSKGGVPIILYPTAGLGGSGICGNSVETSVKAHHLTSDAVRSTSKAVYAPALLILYAAVYAFVAQFA